MVILCCCGVFILCFAYGLLDMKVAWQRCDLVFWHAGAFKLPFLLFVGSSGEQFQVSKSFRKVSASVHHPHCIKLTLSTTDVLQ